MIHRVGRGNRPPWVISPPLSICDAIDNLHQNAQFISYAVTLSAYALIVVTFRSLRVAGRVLFVFMFFSYKKMCSES